MLKFLCLAVFVVGAFANQLEDEIFHRTISTYDGRIVGGDEATVGQFPHQVSLRVRNGQRHFCGGSIISDRFILTAAHCTQNQTSNPANVRAVVGAHRVSTGGTQYALDRIVNHPGFSMQTIANDISVLRTTQRIAFSPLIQAIALPTADVPAEGGVPAFLSGWGQFRVSSFEYFIFRYQTLYRNFTMNSFTERRPTTASQPSRYFAMEKYKHNHPSKLYPSFASFGAQCPCKHPLHHKST